MEDNQMRRTITGALVAAAMLLTGIAIAQTGPVYTDIEGRTSEQAIINTAAAGCYDGLWDGPEFRPRNRVTREQLATVIDNCILEGTPSTTTTITTTTTTPTSTTAVTSTTTTSTTTTPPTTTTVTTTTAPPATTTTAPPVGLWIPGWNGPEVGTLDDPATLPAYTGQTSFSASDGTVIIEGVRVSDTIINDGADLIFRNVWFDGGGYWWGIINDAGTVLVEDSLSTPPDGWSSYIWITGNNQTVRRTLIHPGEDGIRVGDNSTYEQIHVTATNQADDYGDAIQATGGSHVSITWSLLENTMQLQQPGAGNAVIIATEDQGQIDDWTIANTVMIGGANGTLQVNDKSLGCPTGFALTDVVISGWINTGTCTPFVEWVNVTDVDGNQIPIPN